MNLGIDPRLQPLLQQKKTPARQLTIEEFRKGAQLLMPLAGPLEDVERVENCVVPKEDGDVLVRFYYPSKDKGLPILLVFHPGGYVRGDLETYDPVCRQIANASNYLVVAVNYSLAPERKFPTPLEEGSFVLNWVFDNAKELGGDPNRISLYGESSGGNLAASLAHVTRDRQGPKLQHQILVYPQLDYTNSFPSHSEFSTGYLLEEDAIEYYASLFLPEGQDCKDPLLSPYYQNNFKGLPNALIITAEFDPLRDEGEAYALKLQQAGAHTEVKRFDGMVHGFMQMADIVGKEGIECVGRALHGA